MSLNLATQKPDSLSVIKEKLSLVLMIYPVAVGLYTAGFFWEIPTDIIGSFEATEFVFKASILYTLGVSSLLLPLLLMTIIYGPIVHSESYRVEMSDKTQPKGEDIPWRMVQPKGKVIHGIASVGIVAVMAVALYFDPHEVSFDPNGLALLLGVIFVGGIIARPLLSVIVWETSKYIFIVTCILIIPLLLGFDDATAKNGSPKLMVGKEVCPVIFSGSQSLILKCRSSVVVTDRADTKVLIWHVDKRR